MTNRKLFMHSHAFYFGVYFSSCESTREIDNRMTLEWVHKQFARRVYIVFLRLHKEAIADNRETILPIWAVPHSPHLQSADDATIEG